MCKWNKYRISKKYRNIFDYYHYYIIYSGLFKRIPIIKIIMWIPFAILCVWQYVIRRTSRLADGNAPATAINALYPPWTPHKPIFTTCNNNIHKSKQPCHLTCPRRSLHRTAVNPTHALFLQASIPAWASRTHTLNDDGATHAHTHVRTHTKRRSKKKAETTRRQVNQQYFGFGPQKTNYERVKSSVVVAFYVRKIW